MDAASSMLIAQLHLSDIDAISRSRAKGIDDFDNDDQVAGDDLELALKLQAEEYSVIFGNFKLALSMNEAMERDREILDRMRLIEQGATDDHQYAEALSRGEVLPEQSVAQRALEDPEFYNEARPPRREREEEDDLEYVSEPGTPVLRAQTPPGRAECVICGDLLSLTFSSYYRAPCEHVYCISCLSDLVTSCLNDESLYPLRCCRKELQVSRLLLLLSPQLRTQFEEKSIEFGTNTLERIYCPNPTCSKFLGSSVVHTSHVTCTRCWTSVCTSCRQPAHWEDCADNTALQQVKDLATQHGWQTCPGCHAIVELNIGCYHMTCRCRTEFCYLCAARWKNCTCPQWEEQRLLTTAAMRVEREVGQNAREARPDVFQRRVEQRVAQLRDRHDCYPHRWLTRYQPGNCEECGHYLNRFLLVCRGCHMAACVRCTRNRL
ncbi:hypothetical protein K435DRAFT_784054, partial [Dendrothele bispora CBS 962.96]